MESVQGEAARLRKRLQHLHLLGLELEGNIDMVTKAKEERVAEIELAMESMQARLEVQLKRKLLALMTQKEALGQEAEMVRGALDGSSGGGRARPGAGRRSVHAVLTSSPRPRPRPLPRSQVERTLQGAEAELSRAAQSDMIERAPALVAAMKDLQARPDFTPVSVDWYGALTYLDSYFEPQAPPGSTPVPVDWYRARPP